MGKTKAEPWFVMERAENLLIVHFTRRDDLVVERQQWGTGIDYLVHITVDGQRTGRMLGIALTARRDLNISKTDDFRDDPLYLSLGHLRYPRDLPFPLCLVVFDVKDDRGFYRWFRKPEVDRKGRASLIDCDENWFRSLDRKALDHIIDQVNHWYDHRPQRA
jgi:hypothetical protein